MSQRPPGQPSTPPLRKRPLPGYHTAARPARRRTARPISDPSRTRPVPRLRPASAASGRRRCVASARGARQRPMVDPPIFSSTHGAPTTSTPRSTASGSSSALGVLGGTALAALAGIAIAGRAMRPIADADETARSIATTRDPSQRIPEPERDDEVGELAADARPDAPRTRRCAVRDRADDAAPARVRRRRVARAADPADEHPRQPRAAPGAARLEAGTDDEQRRWWAPRCGPRSA